MSDIKTRDKRAEITLIKIFCKLKTKESRAELAKTIAVDYFGSKLGTYVWVHLISLHNKSELPYRKGWEILLQDPYITKKESIFDTFTFPQNSIFK